jgi:hypothetical protein
MAPVAVQRPTAVWSGVGDERTEGSDVGFVPLLEVADGDAAVHPLRTSTTNAVPTTVMAGGKRRS